MVNGDQIGDRIKGMPHVRTRQNKLRSTQAHENQKEKEENEEFIEEIFPSRSVSSFIIKMRCFYRDSEFGWQHFHGKLRKVCHSVSYDCYNRRPCMQLPLRDIIHVFSFAASIPNVTIGEFIHMYIIYNSSSLKIHKQNTKENTCDTATDSL